MTNEIGAMVLITRSLDKHKKTETCLYLVIDWLDILGGDSRMNFDRAWEETGNLRGDSGFPENRIRHRLPEHPSCCTMTGTVRSLR